MLLPAIPDTFAQSAAQFTKWSLAPKPPVSFPLRYGFAFPRLDARYWDNDFNKYYAFLTPALLRTQQTLTVTIEGVRTMLNANSLLPHAQLDTQTLIVDSKVLLGTWRVIACRVIKFTDSVDLKTRAYYQYADTNLAQDLPVEQFAIFGPDKMELWTQQQTTNSFKKLFTRNYKLEGKRYLRFSKFLTSASTGQVGIDGNGYLLLHYPRVIEHVKEGIYITYNAIVEQLIFERVKE